MTMHSKHHSLAALEQQQAQSDALFASIGDGAIATDETGKISRVNNAALNILGFKENELLGKWFPGTVLAYDENNKIIEPLDRPIVRAFMEGKPITQKMLYASKNGLVAVSVTVSPVFFNGHPIGAIEVFRDITTELEIDRMKSEFISLASHQLRTPLTAIQTYAHLLSSGFKGAMTKDQHEFMNIILGSVDRMNDIISTLLDVSRMEAGKLRIDYVETDIGSLCDTIIHELQQSANDKQIKLTFKPLAETIKVTTDALLLAESYANLISNSIKYTPELGSVTVEIIRKAEAVVFSVKDTGLGIPTNMQNQIFKKFFRAPNVVKRDTTGTGLGLYMVQQIADMLGGKVWFKSKENKGSTFYFKIPVNHKN